MHRLSQREVANRIFQLAYFIHGDKTVALQITAAVMCKHGLAATAQDKRLYYKPGGRLLSGKARSDPFRTKVFLNEVHLLQRLVYIESEVYERQRERLQPCAKLSEEDMIIRFIKHLVRITTKRNSFYVALGVSRLLFNYKTSETMEIYNLVVQDPDRVKDDYYYRSRKGRLIQEMKDRFGDFISILRGPRGEERFQTRPHPQRNIDLVKKCLCLFTMWDTPCLAPACLDSTTGMMSRFLFTGADPDQEHEVEISRMHALMHPSCYWRLTEALRFDSPESRLEVPKFNLGQDGEDGGMRQCSRELLELEEDEFAFINDNLAEQAARRRAATSGLLRVIVDGNERARIDPDRTSDVRFDVDDSTELIEVRTEDAHGEILLATHLLTYDEIVGAHGPSKFSITLEGNQRLSFIISPLLDSADGTACASVHIGYEEAKSALYYFSRGQRSWLPGLWRVESWGFVSLLKPAVAFGFLILCAVLLFFVLMPKQQLLEVAVGGEGSYARTHNLTQPGAQRLQSPPGGTPDRDARLLIARGRTPQRRKQTVARDNGPGKPASYESQPGETANGESEATRETGIESATIALPDVKSIYVDFREDESFSRRFKDSLTSKLQLSKRFSMAQSAEEADAALKLTVDRGLAGRKHVEGRIRRNAHRRDTEKAVVNVRLVNARGSVIWPLDNQIKGRKYEGTIESIANKFMSDLLTDARRSENKD